MKTQTPMTRDLAHPMQPIGWDGTGVIRFKKNAIVNAMVEECRERGGLDLNKVARAVARGEFSNEDQVQLAQLIGYSVSGFGDLDYVPEAVAQAADLQAEAVAGNEATPHPNDCGAREPIKGYVPEQVATTAMPIVAMCEFDGRLFVAMANGVYERGNDGAFRQVRFIGASDG